jgi:hypothetical protein
MEQTASTCPDIMRGERENTMQGYRYVRNVALVAALATCGACQGTLGMRVYDQPHQDYHVWNDNENRAYQRYTVENHQGNVKFSKLSASQQGDYWNWRHEHPDTR